ncbi:DNA-binding anti-repressor SinI [Bacillus aerolatus]|uniref:DNA-binding anti-repressor SinI n=1 Tax=Bacillus aerolatus TaxID=2653354 RepID=A0A6I1FHW9_9BACI|nr:DNA-binding anti-repressor SinI [Bacillus aerolatus]
MEDTQRRKLEEEWIALILTAKQIGLTPDEVREFIKQNKGSKTKQTHLIRP